MQIVIEMSEHEYEVALRDGWVHGFYSEKIKNGKPLPKGHGRLIDADAMKTIKNIQSANFNAFELIRYWIDNQPTIIEADKEEQNNADSN